MSSPLSHGVGVLEWGEITFTTFTTFTRFTRNRRPTPDRASSGRVEPVPWQWTGSAMAVAVLGSMEGEASVDGDSRLQLLEPTV